MSVGVEILNPPFLVAPVGYAHMARVRGPAGTVLLLGGIVGMDASGIITAPDDLVAQMDRALANVRALVEYAGGRVEQIARLRIYTTDMAGYQARRKELGQVWRRHLGKHYPAMALLGVQALVDPGARIEIEGEAYLPG